MKCCTNIWILYIIITLTKLSLQCFRDYVPDVNVEEPGFVSENQRRDETLDCECGVKNPTSNSDDDEEVDPEEFPWVVSIKRIDSQRICGGSIINDMIIITSVICVVELADLNIKDDLLKHTVFDKSKIEVMHKHNGKMEKLEIRKVNCHPRTIPTFMISSSHIIDMDICAIHLKHKLTFDKSKKMTPICLPKAPGLNLVGQKAIMLGWSLPSEILIKKEGWIFSHELCDTKSTRIFCTQYGTPLETFEFHNEGSPIMSVLKSGRYIQSGISSFKYLGPSSGFTSTPLDYSSNLGSPDLIHFINNESHKAKAKWCKHKSSDVDLPKPSGAPSALKIYKNNPWEGITSHHRRVSSTCRCGVRKSLRGNVNSRIVRGKEAPKHEYGWQVQLLTKMPPKKQEKQGQQQGCGASLINSKMVLTAAHCIATDNSLTLAKPKDIEVKVGRHRGFAHSDSNSETLTVKSVFSHPGYKLSNMEINHDIALLELDKPVEFSSIRDVTSVCLQTSEEVDIDLVNMTATVIGWGLTIPNSTDSLASTLQELTVPIKEVNECKAAGRLQFFSVPDNTVCAGRFKRNQEYQDPGQGDSGGPLMVSLETSTKTSKLHNMVQVGIVSAGTYSLVHKTNNRAVVWYSSVPDYLSYIDFLSYRAGATWCMR